MKRVRYVGALQMTVNDLPRLQARARELGEPEPNEADIWDYEAGRLGVNKGDGTFGPVTAALPGITIRSLGKNEGLSRKVRWGPEEEDFIQDVSNADWEAIQKLPEASHWELVGDVPDDAPAKAKPSPGSPAKRTTED